MWCLFHGFKLKPAHQRCPFAATELPAGPQECHLTCRNSAELFLKLPHLINLSGCRETSLLTPWLGTLTILTCSQAHLLRVDGKAWRTCWDHRPWRAGSEPPPTLGLFFPSQAASLGLWLLPDSQTTRRKAGPRGNYRRQVFTEHFKLCFLKLYGSTSWVKEATSSWRSGGETLSLSPTTAANADLILLILFKVQGLLLVGCLVGLKNIKRLETKKTVCLYQ